MEIGEAGNAGRGLGPRYPRPLLAVTPQNRLLPSLLHPLSGPDDRAWSSAPHNCTGRAALRTLRARVSVLPEGISQEHKHSEASASAALN